MLKHVCKNCISTFKIALTLRLSEGFITTEGGVIVKENICIHTYKEVDPALFKSFFSYGSSVLLKHGREYAIVNKVFSRTQYF